jgi:hypothetical protein
MGAGEKTLSETVQPAGDRALRAACLPGVRGHAVLTHDLPRAAPRAASPLLSAGFAARPRAGDPGADITAAR